MGLGATIITFTPNTTIKSADVNSNLSNLNGSATPTFTSATLNQAPILAAGNQDNGHWSAQFDYAATAQNIGNSIAFRMHLTNVPTSLTFTAQNSFNVTGPTVANLDRDGAEVSVTCNHTGGNNYGWWRGTYATVGNCLLAVDAENGTFDHHCDACKRVALDVPFGDLRIVLNPYARKVSAWQRLLIALHLRRGVLAPFLPGLSAISYQCRACGAVECFNTALTATDERDETVMVNPASTHHVTYGEQAQRIRALTRALGYPTTEDAEDDEAQGKRRLWYERAR